MHDITIGTMVRGNQDLVDYISTILPHGFETFAISFWQHIPDNFDLQAQAAAVAPVIDGQARISALSIFGNPLGEDEAGLRTRQHWYEAIDACQYFDCDLVTGFTGRNPGSIPDNIPAFQQVWQPLADYAGERGVRIAFENCSMEGDWHDGQFNIAHSPQAWELMFASVPHDNIGLEWEPCHQLVKLIDPLPQLRHWHDRIFHIHGKDATIYWDVIRESGLGGSEPIVHHRHPGFGDSDWKRIISDLRRFGFTGSIDIEGWHDPVYKDELEMTGQVAALTYLKECRGGDRI